MSDMPLHHANSCLMTRCAFVELLRADELSQCCSHEDVEIDIVSNTSPASHRSRYEFALRERPISLDLPFHRLCFSYPRTEVASS